MTVLWILFLALSNSRQTMSFAPIASPPSMYSSVRQQGGGGQGIELGPISDPSTRRAMVTRRMSSSPSQDENEVTAMIGNGDILHDSFHDEENYESDQILVDDEEDNEQIPRFGSESYVLTQAGIIGVTSGLSVGAFKLAIDAVRQLSYGSALSSSTLLLPLIPALGGVVVGTLRLCGAFPPGLRGTVKEVDERSREPIYTEGNQIMSGGRKGLQFLRKTAAAIFTLGTGNSLGPEGPAVEVGMAMSQTCMTFLPMETGSVESNTNSRGAILRRIKRNRLLLSCGAAAGVSAGFNAPIAGVFCALEIMQGTFVSLADSARREDRIDPEQFTTSPGNISAILLASVLSALVSRALLGNHLVLELSDYTLKAPLVEMPLYLLLGATSGVVAAVFSQTAKWAKSLFDGEVGPGPIRATFSALPNSIKPVIGGLLCGLIGIAFPQVLFFGYETLNSLLANSSLPTTLLLTLLVVKILSTALVAGSGLVGGTFAPSLFLGAMTGASFHNIASWVLMHAMDSRIVPAVLGGTVLELADVPAYAMVGAASTLAALFRAPLTASLLLFELTRDYDVILPLMASAGVASLVGDIIEQKIERERVTIDRRDVDPVSWGDLASSIEAESTSPLRRSE